MKVSLKIESSWLEIERKSMLKMKREYEQWEAQTLQKAKEAKDLETLREIFYKLGDRWEWNQATGAWLSSGKPLDTIGFILKMPGLLPNKERFVLYGIMAYSKGLTDQFDHLGDKERVIIERDNETGRMICWSTTGHGAMDLLPTELTMFDSVEDVLNHCYIVAQPGDHAMRLEIPRDKRHPLDMNQRLWEMASGGLTYSTNEIIVLTTEDIEHALDFKFYRYAKAVIDLERTWKELHMNAFSKAKEVVQDKIPAELERRMNGKLREVEGLLHILWFKPPVRGLEPAKQIYHEFNSSPEPTVVEQTLAPYLGELVYALNDIIEKAKYIKWKSVIDRKEFSENDVFKGLGLSNVVTQAFAVALQDILQEHTLAYIGYPEKGTMKSKAMRIVLGFAVLPARLVMAFTKSIGIRFRNLRNRLFAKQEKPTPNPVGDEGTVNESILQDQ